jgi:uncharacterized membrane protein YdjX (TVP38/TMEM64 family)
MLSIADTLHRCHRKRKILTNHNLYAKNNTRNPFHVNIFVRIMSQVNKVSNGELYRPHPNDAGARIWKWVGPIFLMLIIGGAAVAWLEHQETLMAWKSELQPLPFFALLTVLAMIGIPTTPLFILAGLLFGPEIALVGAAGSVLGYLTLSYGIARGPLRGWTDRLGGMVERRAPDGLLKSPAARVALVRLMPVLPNGLKNYAAASMGAKLPLYLAVSWPLSFVCAASLIVLGDSLATQRPEEALIALVIILPVAVVAFGMRRWCRNHQTNNEQYRIQENPDHDTYTGHRRVTRLATARS